MRDDVSEQITNVRGKNMAKLKLITKNQAKLFKIAIVTKVEVVAQIFLDDWKAENLPDILSCDTTFSEQYRNIYRG